ncbi:MAG: bifunctional folylpolyglutamate synthase/dihydrofolate synthase [Ruminococcus sp.]|nr:bifunctional folylpolyglutamate synthase/dihydrofolate synthase [Ruminococcus sp.]
MSNTHLDFINSFTKKGKIIENLDRIKTLMQELGNPERELKFVHIAGTNGKGSMAQMFSEILVDAGYKTGLFTSPYLIEYNDRIKINGNNISDDDLEAISREIKPVVEKLDNYQDFSQFEITQAVAFVYFKKQGCDVVVLEAGVGGLLDSTNVIEKPLVSVIGSIALDHTDILGDTIEQIAHQKAGIIKKDCPCVLSAGNDMTAVRVVREKAMEAHAQLVIPNLYLCRAEKWDVFGCKFAYKGEEFQLSMGGLHQINNALTVIEAVKFVAEKMPLTLQNVKNGLLRAKLYARVEVLCKKPLTILDGGHNADGMKALAKSLEGLSAKPVVAIIGMIKGKDSADAIKQLIPFVDEFICVDGFYPQERSKAELAEIITNAGGKAKVSELTAEMTLEKLMQENLDGVNLVCGSLFLASKIKANMLKKQGE